MNEVRCDDAARIDLVFTDIKCRSPAGIEMNSRWYGSAQGLWHVPMSEPLSSPYITLKGDSGCLVFAELFSYACGCLAQLAFCMLVSTLNLLSGVG